MKKSFKQDISRQYVKRFPKTPSLTLARKMYDENIEHFKDVEDARLFIRVVRGLAGNTARKTVKDKTLFVKKGNFKLNPFSLPKSYSQKKKEFKLPSNHNNILFISDLHIPYHDVTALSTAIDFGKKNNINTIFINGDILDFYQISRFTNVQRKRSVREELEAANEVLDVLNREFPGVPIYLLKGNHDMRLELYLAVKAPELLDMPEYKLENLLHAKHHNLVVLDDTTLVKIGKLSVTHGHLLIRGIFAPVNAARGAFMKAKASVMISHVHKVSSHTETTINGKTIACYSTGCMCELNPDYTPFANNYSHGFAHITVEQSGNYRVRNVQIIDGLIIS